MNGPQSTAGSPFSAAAAFLWTLVAVGAALRIYQYACDTSLWFDELSIVRNLVHRYGGAAATEPLRYRQVAPVGFIAAEKGISQVLGESDLAFRFLLLPVGLAALVLFVPLARRILDGYAVPFAVAMFAIGAPFIRYCAEVKQYGIDVAAAIALSLVALRLRDPDSTAGRCIRAGIAGAVLVWFSQMAVFVLAGLGAALFLVWLRDRDVPTRRALVYAAPIWAVGCAAAKRRGASPHRAGDAGVHGRLLAIPRADSRRGRSGSPETSSGSGTGSRSSSATKWSSGTRGPRSTPPSSSSGSSSSGGAIGRARSSSSARSRPWSSPPSRSSIPFGRVWCCSSFRASCWRSRRRPSGSERDGLASPSGVGVACMARSSRARRGRS